MKYTRIDPALPTIGRWVSLCRRFPGVSTIRKLEYEKLTAIDLKGKVLDVGGGNKARYMHHLPSDIEYDSVNIDPEMEPTWQVEPGEKLQIENDVFDNCISMNTLEHVYDPKPLISEMFRVLKPGGKVHITVPWMFRIHGHPDDFTRASPSWWKTTMQETGFRETTILPLVWGRYSTASTISNFRGLLKKTRNHMTHLRDVLYARCVFFGSGGRYTGRRGQRICNVALGHFITATK